MRLNTRRAATILLATIAVSVIGGIALVQRMRADPGAPGEREARFGRQLTIARVMAFRMHADDRDLAMMTSNNWVSKTWIDGLLSPSSPAMVPWRNQSSTEWQPTLTAPDGSAFTVPVGDEPIRLGQCVFVPLTAQGSPAEWSMILLEVPGRDDVVMVMIGTDASFVARNDLPAELEKQNSLRKARSASPMGDPQTLPDLLGLSSQTSRRSSSQTSPPTRAPVSGT